ncbi:protein of unknown function [Acidithiobacillus ferrivorans]|jgi:hypothetical protein|uniref:Uncharacterized protein n=1 Tax=Acidithiobacillus ferrivorans TaxID=160808 RepID=A0A060UUS1_9PROT|nr:hypothetical protein [Acidithiobacillus ferrivorans]QQD71992.1 hypothetical protein H2515_11220 [Acidithiobacillus ferrivorans]CDQ12061.1 conserved hypothetical protein [Acidithiobacillus ferrivorans]SMH64812.1 protein of unknown function [Acidithiobacillus ferrivorans]
MYDNLQENQGFIDDAKARGLDTLAYHDQKSQGFMLVAGHPDSIRLLGEILDDYEEHGALKPESINSTKSIGENEHAQ